MADPIIVQQGEDKTINVLLTLATGQPKDLTDASDSTITAQLTTHGTSKTAVGSAVTCLSSDTGADWRAGWVSVVFTDTNTATMSAGTHALEIKETEDGGAVNFFVIEQAVTIDDTVQ